MGWKLRPLPLHSQRSFSNRLLFPEIFQEQINSPQKIVLCSFGRAQETFERSLQRDTHSQKHSYRNLLKGFLLLLHRESLRMNFSGHRSRNKCCGESNRRRREKPAEKLLRRWYCSLKSFGGGTDATATKATDEALQEQNLFNLPFQRCRSCRLGVKLCPS